MKLVELYAPERYWNLTAEQHHAFTNGCGTGGWKGELIPETVWGLSVSDACDIHDFMYAVGATIADKEEADRVFLNNMLRIIDAAGGFSWLKALRRRRAHVYFEAVSHFGGPAFWNDKNSEARLQEVAI